MPRETCRMMGICALSGLSTASVTSAAQADCGSDVGYTYYVRPDGNDANDGHSYEAAFRTIQRAADVAVAAESVCISAGRYRERVTLPRSGASDTERVSFIGEAPMLPCLDEAQCTILDPSDQYPDGWVQCVDENCSAEGVSDPKVWKRTGTSPGFYHYALLAGPDGKKYPIFSASCGDYAPPGCASGAGAGPASWTLALSDGPLVYQAGDAYGGPKIHSWQGVPALLADPEGDLDTTLLFRVSGAAAPTYVDGQSPNGLDIDFVPRVAALDLQSNNWITVKNIAVPASWVALQAGNATGLRLEGLTVGPSRRSVYLYNVTDTKLQNSYFYHGWWPTDGLAGGAPIDTHAGGNYQWMAYALGKTASASESGSNPSAGIFINVTDFEFSGNIIADAMAGPAFTSGVGGNYTPGTAGTRVQIHHNRVERNNASAFWVSDNQVDLQAHDNLMIHVDQCFRHFIGAGPAYFYRNRCFSTRAPTTSGFGPDYDRMLYAPPYHGVVETPKIYWYHNSVSTKICMRVANTYSDEGETKPADGSGVRWFDNLFACDLIDENTGGPWAARTLVDYNWFNVPAHDWMLENNVVDVGTEPWDRCGSEPCPEPNWQPPSSAFEKGIDVTQPHETLGIAAGGLPGFSPGYFTGGAPTMGALQPGEIPWEQTQPAGGGAGGSAPEVGGSSSSGIGGMYGLGDGGHGGVGGNRGDGGDAQGAIGAQADAGPMLNANGEADCACDLVGRPGRGSTSVFVLFAGLIAIRKRRHRNGQP